MASKKTPKEKKSDTFFERALDSYLKENFYDGIKVLFGRYLGFTLIIILGLFFLGGTSLIWNTPLGILFVLAYFFVISIICSLIITGVFSLITSSTIARNGFFILSCFFTFFFLVSGAIFIPNQLLLFLHLGLTTPLLIFSTGFVILGLFFVIQQFQKSWLARISITGKSRESILFQKQLKLLAVISIVIPFYLTFKVLILGELEFIGLSVMSFLTYFLVLLVLYRKKWYRKHQSFDFFAFTIVVSYMFTFLSLILFLFNSDIISLLFFGALMALSIVTLVQVANPENKRLLKHRVFEKEEIEGLKRFFLERRKREEEFYSKKGDKDIIIIEIDDDERETKKIRKKPKPRSMGAIKKSLIKKRDASIAILLAVFVATSFFFIQNMSFIIPQFINQAIPQISLNLLVINLNFMGFKGFTIWFTFFTLLLVILLILGYFGTKKMRSWTTNKFSQKNAFLEFLSLIEMGERRELLDSMADTAREILISGIIDLFDPTSEGEMELGESIKAGFQFLRRFFGARSKGES